MSSRIVGVGRSRITAIIFLTVLSGAEAPACASENEEKAEFLIGVGERIIEESCRSDNIYSQCIGQSGTECERAMRLGFSQCVEKFIDSVPDLSIDPKSLGDNNQTPYHKLGEDFGQCLAEEHLKSLAKDKDRAYECLDFK